MKSILLFVFLLIKAIAYCQVTFEELPIPPDFNLQAVRQSPTGEYFVQAANDEESIYSSVNGVEWIKEMLPIEHRLGDIQFFSDGTPVLQWTFLDDARQNLIRRIGAWYILPAEAIFIKEDTLFVYADKTFSYSLDKGMTFATVFTMTENINAQTSHLWKPANHFILQYTTGSHSFLAAFEESGNSIINTDFNLPGGNIVYNDCGQILFYDHSPFVQQYRLISEPGFLIQSGSTLEIFPIFSYEVKLLSQQGQYYARDKNTIYKSTGCNFEWNVMDANDLIDSMDQIWIDQNKNIFLYDDLSNHYFRKEFDDDRWVKHDLEMDYPRVFSVDEAENNNQFVLTPNYLFYKKSLDSIWGRRDSIGGSNFQVQYAPNGNLYINKNVYLEYSADNGATYSVIEVPQGGGPVGVNFMQVLDNNMIFFWIKLLGEYYYTLNNGQDWIKADIVPSLRSPLVKLIDSTIIAVNFETDFWATRVNIITNEVTSENFGQQGNDLILGATLSDDGSVYFQRYNIINDIETLYKYRFGQGVKTLGHFHDLIDAGNFEGIDDELYCFGSYNYYVYNGQNLEEHSYAGLPDAQTNISFSVSDNKHVYAIVDYGKVYRSVDPVTGIREIAAITNLNIYPNPAISFINISVSDSDLKKFDSFEIFNVLGGIVQSGAFNRQTINIEDLLPGVYLLRLKENGVVYGAGKFIKL